MLTKPFRFENQNLESHINFGSACQFNGGAPPPSTSSLLATSSFNRRKSYNPSESIAMRGPLAYNPHVGKLKPVEISTKSIHYTNENEKRLMNESVSIKTAAIDKRKSVLIAQRNIEKEKLGVKRKMLRNNEMDKPRKI